MISNDPWVWLAVLLTFCIFSFLYRDNPLFKLAEHLFVGTSVGYLIAIYWHQGVIPLMVNPMLRVWSVVKSSTFGKLVTMTEFYYICPIALGLLMFSRFSRRYTWLSRWPIAFVIGLGSGIGVPLSLQNYVFKQMEGTVGLDFTISNVILIIGVITTLFYFFFSVPHKGPAKRIARVGIYFIMIAFGAAFGLTVMARVSLLIGRIQFLVHDWLGLIR